MNEAVVERKAPTQFELAPLIEVLQFLREGQAQGQLLELLAENRRVSQKLAICNRTRLAQRKALRRLNKAHNNVLQMLRVRLTYEEREQAYGEGYEVGRGDALQTDAA